jgi:hypothetical protein
VAVGSGVPDDEPTSGVATVDEDGALGESAGLIAGADFELSRDDALTLGKDLKFVAGVDVAVDVAAAVDVAVAVAVDLLAAGVAVVGRGAGVVQWGVGAGPPLAACPDGLAWWLGLAVAAALGLGLAVGVSLGLGLAVGVSLGLGLSEGLAPALAEPLPSPPLDDTAGLVVTASWVGELALPDEPDAAGVAAACLEVDKQGVALALGSRPAMLPDESPEPVDTGAAEWPSVDSVPDEVGVPVMAELRFEPMWAISLRVEGTTARTTPMRNTARPVAKAGRSIASRQSLGCFGARRSGARCPAGSRRRTREPRFRDSWVPNAAMPPQMAITPCRPLAWADRDRIFSRIRSRPSAPGWIWSPAA